MNRYTCSVLLVAVCMFLWGADMPHTFAQPQWQTLTFPLATSFPIDVFPTPNPMAPGTTDLEAFPYPLAGADQIPVNAKIERVDVIRVCSAYFHDGFDTTTVAWTLFVTNGSAFRRVDGRLPADSPEPMGNFGANVYRCGGGGYLYTNPITDAPWTRAELINYMFGFWAKWINHDIQNSSPAARQSFSEYSVDVQYSILTISGSTVLYSFNGATPSGWPTSATLTSSGGASTTWTLVSGSDKVSLSTTQGAQTTVNSAPAGVSASLGDVVIRASANGATAEHQMTERTPYSLAPGTVSTTCDPTWAYVTLLNYTILDQFGATLPAGISLPLNEQWTTGVVDDYPKNNWGRGSAVGTTTSTGAFSDGIQGERSNRRPQPTCDPFSAQPVQHWGQAWQIGSLTIGAGKQVQTNTLQKNLGRALHTNVVTPP